MWRPRRSAYHRRGGGADAIEKCGRAWWAARAYEGAAGGRCAQHSTFAATTCARVLRRKCERAVSLRTALRPGLDEQADIASGEHGGRQDGDLTLPPPSSGTRAGVRWELVNIGRGSSWALAAFRGGSGGSSAACAHTATCLPSRALPPRKPGIIDVAAVDRLAFGRWTASRYVAGDAANIEDAGGSCSGAARHNAALRTMRHFFLLTRCYQTRHALAQTPCLF